MARKYPINGYTLYRGPSMIDGKPIIMIGTGFADASDNTKTGKALIQTWILRDNIHPNNAIHTEDDYSVCGDCIHRGRVVWDTERLQRINRNRTCYVKVFQAPSNVWKAYHNERYPEIDALDIPEIFNERGVRFGSYGDPAAVPFKVINAIGRSAKFVTGYTHQWKSCDGKYGRWIMASADTEQDYEDAKSLGYRVFRVRADFEDVLKGEFACPASKEMGHKTTCDQCKACGGHSSKARADVTIMAHGDACRVLSFNKYIASRRKAA